MKKTNQIAWLLWLLVCTSLSFFISYGGCAHAQDTQVILDVPCPKTALCVKNEKGIWIPYWYARDLMKAKTELKGSKSDLEKANSEIDNLRIADAEHIAAEKAFEDNLAMARVRVEESEKDSKRRLHWAVGTSVVGTAAISILTALLIGN